jgi:hypothetical protein
MEDIDDDIDDFRDRKRMRSYNVYDSDSDSGDVDLADFLQYYYNVLPYGTPIDILSLMAKDGVSEKIMLAYIEKELDQLNNNEQRLFIQEILNRDIFDTDELLDLNYSNTINQYLENRINKILYGTHKKQVKYEFGKKKYKRSKKKAKRKKSSFKHTSYFLL